MTKRLKFLGIVKVAALAFAVPGHLNAIFSIIGVTSVAGSVCSATVTLDAPSYANNGNNLVYSFVGTTTVTFSPPSIPNTNPLTLSPIPAGSYTLTVTSGPGLPSASSFGLLLQSLDPATVTVLPGCVDGSKSFDEVSVGPGSTVGLNFTLKNPNPALTLTGVGFTDSLPAGLIVATPSALAGTCGGGTITAVAGSSTVSLTGATLAPLASCAFSVKTLLFRGYIGPEELGNNISTLSSNEAPPGGPVSASLFVGDPFQISYVANLSVGDSFINITNGGAAGAGLNSGTTASTTGAVCANVYAFTPDEQMVSCCSCPVTPDGLMKLSAKTDLASNTLTPAIPTALVIKLLATVPVGGSCSNSAASVATATLANGMKSYDTTLHATPPAGTYGVTEKPFSAAMLSAGELSRIGQLCNFIIANGSGFGQCRSCTLGGLGANFQ